MTLLLSSPISSLRSKYQAQAIPIQQQSWVLWVHHQNFSKPSLPVMYKFPQCSLLLDMRVVGAIEGSALHMLVLVIQQSFLIMTNSTWKLVLSRDSSAWIFPIRFSRSREIPRWIESGLNKILSGLEKYESYSGLTLKLIIYNNQIRNWKFKQSAAF